MADADAPVNAPPVGEQIHMPGSSSLPIVNAAGLSVGIIGVTISPVMVAFGALVFLISTIAWVRAASRELDELPAEHH